MPCAVENENADTTARQKREKNTAQKKYANRKLKIKNLLTEFKESAKIREVKGKER